MSDPVEATGPRRGALIFLIVVIALNLRPFLAAPGPILPRIAQDTGLGYGTLSLLTLLPMLLMGVGAFVSPFLQAVIGTRRGLLSALGLLLFGSALRLFAADGAVLILTAVLCGAGVAFVQSALPGLIKEKFAQGTAAMTGLYSAMIMTGGAVGAQLVPAFVDLGHSWPAALALLSLPVLVALAVTWRILSETRVTRPDPGLILHLFRRPRTWMLMALFGLINGGYSSMIAWLAPYYQEQGWSNAQSGALISVMAISQGCGAVALPLLARRRPDRRRWLWATIAMQATGFAGLAFAPAVVPLFWPAICGIGLAGSFALCLIVALDHLPRPEQAGPLAALMQGGGFLLASMPPFILARLHEGTGGFAAGWIMHLGWIAVAAALVLRLDPAGYGSAMDLPPAAAR
ncbi:MFS transporter, CP family, cyanate transporter [Paracoccus aminovorans]|uniref:MFS transporter, CP family, cyanate transporter n=1 Tax=Paracoccus aminovorans TaxID=34004 RepID=A0A1I3EIK6_9RHOB|nr:MFS transporter [Paracoccus aminovorans]CQR84356.1 major facilitator transporter [Paracoccus aminovorans]SFH98824.1 MFS transporter, CP family, cyanate transporter [Paracoccus aminovorans]